MVATTKVQDVGPAPTRAAQKRVAQVRDPSWETASFVIGIGGAVVSALLTVWLVMIGTQGNTLAAYTGVGVVLGTWVIGMVVLWIGVASVPETR